MAPRPGLAALATLAALLLASAAAQRPLRFSIRERPPSICGFANYGSAVGSEQRLVETHLAPGVADWNIVVPMPPPCADAQVMGVDMQVCDDDAPPDVSMSDVRSARVHRTGSLAGFAAVNVTVYCILPPPPTTPSPPPTTPPPPPTTPPPPPTTPTPPPTTPPPPPATAAPPSSIPPLVIPPRSSEPLTPASDPTDLSSLDDMSNELKSFEVSSNEEMSDESVSKLSASIEETSTAKPTSSTTTAKPTSSTTTAKPTSSTTTAKPTSSTTTAKPTSSTTLPTSSTTLSPILEETTARVELAHPPDKTTRPKGKKPQSIQVTINITPTDQMSTEEEMSTESHAYDGELPSVSNKEKDEVRPSHSPSFSSEPYITTPPRFPEIPPRKHMRHPRRPGRPLHRPPPSALQPAPGAPESLLYAPPFPPRASFAASPFPLAPSYPVAPIYRPFGVIDPRLRFLQRRQPLMFFRQF